VARSVILLAGPRVGHIARAFQHGVSYRRVPRINQNGGDTCRSCAVDTNRLSLERNYLEPAMRSLPADLACFNRRLVAGGRGPPDAKTAINGPGVPGQRRAHGKASGSALPAIMRRWPFGRILACSTRSQHNQVGIFLSIGVRMSSSLERLQRVVRLVSAWSWQWPPLVRPRWPTSRSDPRATHPRRLLSRLQEQQKLLTQGISAASMSSGDRL